MTCRFHMRQRWTCALHSAKTTLMVQLTFDHAYFLCMAAGDDDNNCAMKLHWNCKRMCNVMQTTTAPHTCRLEVSIAKYSHMLWSLRMCWIDIYLVYSNLPVTWTDAATIHDWVCMLHKIQQNWKQAAVNHQLRVYLNSGPRWLRYMTETWCGQWFLFVTPYKVTELHLAYDVSCHSNMFFSWNCLQWFLQGHTTIEIDTSCLTK